MTFSMLCNLCVMSIKEILCGFPPHSSLESVRVIIMWLWLALVLASTPFSLPSLYLAHKMIKTKFLDSVFNQHIALMMVFAGGFSFATNCGKIIRT